MKYDKENDCLVGLSIYGKDLVAFSALIGSIIIFTIASLILVTILSLGSLNSVLDWFYLIFCWIMLLIFPFAVCYYYAYPRVGKRIYTHNRIIVMNIFGKEIKTYEFHSYVRIGIALFIGDSGEKITTLYISDRDLEDEEIKNIPIKHNDDYIFTERFNKNTIEDKRLEKLKEFYNCEVKDEELAKYEESSWRFNLYGFDVLKL